MELPITNFKIETMVCTAPDFFRVYIATPDGQQMCSWNITLHRSSVEELIEKLKRSLDEADSEKAFHAAQLKL